MERSVSAKPRICRHVSLVKAFRRQRRTATGIVSETETCSAGSFAIDSSTTQSISAPGSARAISLATGRLCTMSPSEEVFTRSMRGIEGNYVYVMIRELLRLEASGA